MLNIRKIIDNITNTTVLYLNLDTFNRISNSIELVINLGALSAIILTNNPYEEEHEESRANQSDGKDVLLRSIHSAVRDHGDGPQTDMSLEKSDDVAGEGGNDSQQTLQ